MTKPAPNSRLSKPKSGRRIFGADQLKDRIVRCRSAANMLVDLDRIDDLRWGVEAESSRAMREQLREWPATFLRIGVIVGQAAPRQAAEAVNRSLVRDRLLAALDLWLISAAEAERAEFAAILASADPNPYRDALRAIVQKSAWTAVGPLAAKEEASASRLGSQKLWRPSPPCRGTSEWRCSGRQRARGRGFSAC